MIYGAKILYFQIKTINQLKKFCSPDFVLPAQVGNNEGFLQSFVLHPGIFVKHFQVFDAGGVDIGRFQPIQRTFYYRYEFVDFHSIGGSLFYPGVVPVFAPDVFDG